MALRFEKAFGGGADMWLRMQAAFDLAQARKRQPNMDVPRLAELAAILMGVKRAIPGRLLLRTTNAPAWCSTIRAGETA